MLTKIKSAFDSIFSELMNIQDTFSAKSAEHARELADLRQRIKENIEAQTAFSNGVDFLASGLTAIADEARTRAESTQYAFTDLLAIDEVASEPDQFIGNCANCGKPICVTDNAHFEVEGELFCADCEEYARAYEDELCGDEDEDTAE